MSIKSKACALILIASFLILPVVLTSVTSANTEPAWNTQTLDAYAWAGGNCPIAVDANNVTHIAYMDFPTGTNTLVYASYDGVAWTNQTVVSGNVHVVFSLVLDSKGNPYILYNPDSLGSVVNPLILATRNENNWTIQNTVTSYADTATLMLDSNGNPHIAYTTGVELKYGDSWVGSALDYASWKGDTWNIQTIDSTMNDSFTAVSLALDQNNKPYILYSLMSNSSDTRLATYENSTWNVQTVPLPASTTTLGNIAMDSKGYPHFLCTHPEQNKTQSTIFYASFNGTAWNMQAIVSNVILADTASVSQLVLDAQDRPHFCYINSDGEPIYIFYSGSAWISQPVSSNISVTSAVGPCFLALDDSGNPHLSYRTYSPMRYTANLIYSAATEPTSTPYVPELSWLAVLPLLLSLFSVAVMVRHRKRVKKS